MRIEGKGGDDTAANSIVFQCSNARGTDVIAHTGFWGDWTATRYCPGETYICGLQTRVESSDASDDTAMNGLRIACCNFPTNTETAVISSGAIMTRGSATSGTCLDVTFNNQSPGTFIQQWACSSGENAAQYFTITSTSTGAYTITTTQKGLCLTVQNGGTGYGTRIILDNCVNGARNQAWSIVPVGSDRANIFTVRPTHASEMCLDISGSSSANGAVVQLWGCNGTPAQFFSLSLPTRANTGSVQALAGENDRCLDVSGNRQNPGTYIQTFTVTAAGTNAYQLKSSGGFCMTVQNAGSFSGARIIIDRCVNGASNQLFRASAGYQGGVSLSPFHATNLCLDVSNGSTNNGAVVQLWNCNGSKSQSWKVTLPVS
ncbi:hypothetical protein GPECTOR_27g650 [Gonium pectorale]|uniref:Ricin B lectin domain-containing protein n=1 Tax=Gonium pectorale TaxID=33097 RepID=A0A150GGK3_GONPE|nr:hypothetical protein GPECTOR_27g650 [Gonium pectorale]|eukprot:KXZ48480.1 hypothetical protein GPECTOR_27g650 [Gonium pectorale]